MGGMAYAVKTAGEFSGKFGEITTLISATGAPVDAFRQQILDYATTSVKSIADINQSIYNAISAGVDYSQSIDFINASEKLSIAGRANLADTTKVLISTLNAYGAGTDQATKYSDIMFMTVKLGQTTLSELSTQLAKVTGLAASSGVPFETLSAAIAALTVAGLPTEQALTGIKAALTNIIKPTSESEKMAAALGIQFNATALQTKGFEGVLWDAWKATGGSTEKMAQLFGSVEALNAVLILASDKTGKFKEALVGMNTASGATAENYAKVANEFENMNQKLVNIITVMVTEVGQKLLPLYAQIVNSTGEISEGIRKAVSAGAFDSIFQYLSETGSKIGEVLKLIGANLPEAMKGLDFSGLINSFNNLGGALRNAFVAVFGEIDLSTVDGLHKAIQRVIDGMAALINVTKGIIDGMRPLFQALGVAIDNFTEMDEKTSAYVGTALGFAKTLNVIAENAGVLTMALSILSGKALVDIGIMLVNIGGHAATAASGFFTLATAYANINPLFTAGALGVIAGTLLNQVPAVQAVAQGFFELIDVNKTYFGAASRTVEETAKVNAEFDAAVAKNKSMSNALGLTTNEFGRASEAAKTLTTGILEIPSDIKAKISVAMDSKATDQVKFDIAQALAMGDFNKVKILLEIAEREAKEAADKLKTAAPANMTTRVTVQADGTTIEETKDMITKTFPDGTVLLTNVGTKAHAASIAETKATIEKSIPPEKVMEITAKIDEANIKAQSDIVQKAIEWKAKIDIAQIEAAAQTIKVLFASIDNTITSTGETLVGMFDVWQKARSQGGTSFIEDEIKRESTRRDEALQMQKDLTQAQVDLLQQQVEAMKKGGAMIQIDGKGLQPHLEAFMFEILKQIQIKANAEGMKFLVGQISAPSK
jgi:TP901 family phage tail tape measure protein